MQVNTVYNKEAKAHGVALKDRKELSITGIEDIISFDEGIVELCTGYGAMTVEGEGMKVSFLDKEGGMLTLQGKVSGIYYNDKKPKHRKGLFGAEKG